MKESFFSWNEYSFHFTQKAQAIGVPQNAMLELLSYSKALNTRKLPVIFDVRHLSYLTEYREEYILRAITKPENFYRTFSILKKNGARREIKEPLPGLKFIQYWILNNIIKTIPMNKFNNAYSTGKSIVSNAKYHTKQSLVLNVDIEKFFDNITFDMVYNFFYNFGYNNVVSNVLAKLCTLNGSIPQGSPTSPYLSSVLTFDIDNNLFEYCRVKNLRYSRYADDITISGDFHPGQVITDVKLMLQELSFNLNESKTRLSRKHQRQMVTGIIVNKKMSIKKEDLKDIRQIMYYINKYGIESHASKINLSKSNYIEHLLGRINFYSFVRKKDPILLKYKQTFNSIIGKE
jgi:RNA-directed DNA polymerase